MGKKLMIKKLSAVFAVLFLVVSAALVLSKPAEAFDSRATPTMLNRTAIALGDPTKAENIFYDKDTSNNDMVWQNTTKGCYSDIALESTQVRGGTVNKWVLRSSEKLSDGSCSPEKTTELPTPKNYNERKETVFYRDNADVVHSVKADLLFDFVNTGLSARGNVSAIYIEKDVNPFSCPSLIVDQKSPDGWAYVMMERSESAEKASDEYDGLIKDLGAAGFFGSTDISDFNDVCKAAGDDDDEGNLKKIGLPESYFDAGAEKDNYEEVTFGYPGSSIGSVDIHQMFGADAAGMSLAGPLAGGFIASGELEAGAIESDDAPVCSAGALGWVLCPLSEAMVGAIEGIADLLESFLVFQPLTTSEQGKAIKAIWGSLLGIANAGLIVAFLVVVFSQATSIGLNNYGIKKLLPRVIAAAILMNLSFYLCAIAVDISNILGVSIKGIVDVGLEAVTAGISNPELKAEPTPGDWFKISVVGLLGAAILVGTGAIFLLIPVLISGLMAILTAFLILAARQVLITLLIIIAPLAILAWILPNTESWFTKWRKLFTTLLLLYPMVMAIFYGAILVSSVILASAGDSGNAINNWTVQVLAFLVLVVPLFSLPFVMKAAGGVMDRLGVLVNNRNKGFIDRSRKKADEWKGNSAYQRSKTARKSETQARKSRGFYEAMAGEGRRGLRKRTLGRAGYTGMGVGMVTPGRRQDAQRTGENIRDLYRKQQTEATARSLASLVEGGAFSQGTSYSLRNAQGVTQTFDNHRDMVDATLQAGRGSTLSVTDVAGRTRDYNGDDIGGALMSKTAQMGDVPLTERVLAQGGETAAGMREFISYNTGSYATKAPDYIKGAVGAFGDPKAAELAGWHAETSTRAAAYAAQNPVSARNMGAALAEALGNDNLRGDLTTGSVRNLVGNEDTAVWQSMSTQEQQSVRDFLNTHQSPPTTGNSTPPTTPPSGGGGTP